ncbi:GroES-like protein [Glarea lozoyensis ATCC 20868]|uniref:GroES-like protein n=1 Tax=Glarea lozoyensis (strain ATCC 20868 / MF5171) TaxID=1116229 RepID=S3CYU4_GLAL2|nr:GroES-like protein [Glarea lozoyensis ATCC 20868]EPE25006.1 GroES-like protein [Glarea lozoyensis ATCC 20868]
MEALILDVPAKTATVKSIPIPSPAPNELLIRVHAIALNPVDALYTFHPLALPTQQRTVGSDFAGTVHKLGSSVSSPHLQVGTRVAGFLQGACSVNDRPGAFAEYLVVPHDLVWRVPDSMTLESAASVSLCALTAAQGLFPRLAIRAPFPWNDEVYRPNGLHESLRVFIYGASTSLGQYAAQLVRLAAKSSDRPAVLFAAASPGRHAMLRAPPYSYDGLVDYRDEEWPGKFLEEQRQARVDYGVDCISEGESVKRVSKVVNPTGGMAVFRSRAGKAWTAEEGELPFEPIYGAVWEGLGVEIEYYGFTVPASAKAREFTVAFYSFLSNMAGTGLELQPNSIRLMPGGLKNVVNDGFALLGPGTMGDRSNARTEDYMKPISAEKLVYKLVDE